MLPVVVYAACGRLCILWFMQLEDYSTWQSDGSSSPSVKLKINNPPPIKLRIKRDENDKWEAASSVSSYMSEESGDDDSDVDESAEGRYCAIRSNQMQCSNSFQYLFEFCVR